MIQEYLPYLIGVGLSILFMVLFVWGRYVYEEGKKRETDRLMEPDDGDPGIIGGRSPGSPSYSLEGTSPIDGGNLVRDTGLDVSGDQAVAWIVLAGAICGAGMFMVRMEWWMGVIGMVVGSAVTYFSFYFYKSRHRTLMLNQLPDTFYLLARSLRAGLSLEQSINLVGNEGVQPLAGEFKRCASQIGLGLPITAALDIMAKRIDILDFNAFVSTVSLFQTTGGNLPLMLDRLASTSRDRLQFRAFFRSATALGRLSGYGIACAAPLFFVAYALLEPDYLKTFFDSRLGMLSITTALGLEIIGVLWLRILTRIEY